MTLILASASPHRKELLESLGLSFDIIPADIDETPHPKEAPKNYVQRVAREKAETVHQQHAAKVILAADSIVTVQRHILGKPTNRDEAETMMRLQRGKRVHVLTAVAVIAPDGKVFEHLSDNWVKVKPFTEKELNAFLEDKSSWKGVCGAMRILGGNGAAFYPELHGSVSGIIGLPLAETATLLRRAGLGV